jgi:pimeloyl-ACP methyl ester carboxylesterase
MTRPGPDLLLLPGLGADARLFQRQAAAMPGTIFTPPWPPLRRDDSLADFARRLAASLPADLPRVIGGASFGGMVALELAAIIGARTVVLLGSCTGPEAVSPTLRMLGRSLVGLPESTLRVRPWMLPFLSPPLGPLGSTERHLLLEMAATVDPAFLKWGCEAILSWQPAVHGASVFHLHGSADRIIPVDRVRPTQIVQGAGHVLTLSHPAETTEFLSHVISNAA